MTSAAYIFALASLVVATWFDVPAAQAEEQQKIFVSSKIQRVELDISSGNVFVQGTSARTAVVRLTGGFDPQRCETRVEMTPSGTLIVVHRPWMVKGMQMRSACAGDAILELEPETEVHLALGTGDADVSGMRGRLSYNIGTGNVRVSKSAYESIDGQVGQGDIKIEADSLNAGTLKLGAGQVEMRIARIPAKGRLEVRVGTGDTVIYLPRDGRIKSRYKTGLGTLTSEFPKSPRADFEISGIAGSGSMTIKKQ